MSDGATPVRGHRGYIASRPIQGSRVPQNVQNLVLRDYAARKELRYLLSATEYAMPHCYLMLEQVVDDLPQLDGILMYSMFMLPEDPGRRRTIYERVLGCGASLHAAVEEMALESAQDIGRWEDIFQVKRVVDDWRPM